MRLKRDVILAIWVMAFGLLSVAHVCAQPQIQDRKTHSLAPFLPNGNTKDITANYTKLLTKLEKKRAKKPDEAFLKSLFYLTQRSILSEYSKTATMQQTLEKGTFGCLTGTAIYAALLEYFDFEIKIIELPNHVFLIVRADEQSYLFESTLPMDGFMKTNEKLDALLEQPWLNSRNILSLEVVGKWYDNETLLHGFTTIDLNDLAGLQFFNQSVEAYQNKKYKKAMDMSFEAFRLYPSKRSENMMQLVINKLLKQEEIDEAMKDKYLKTYINFIKSNELSQVK